VDAQMVLLGHLIPLQELGVLHDGFWRSCKPHSEGVLCMKNSSADYIRLAIRALTLVT
jgi:hypothetical protein